MNQATPSRELLERASCSPARRDVDFHEVKPQHVEIHARLENWARCFAGGRAKAKPSPMFGLFKSTDARRAGGDADPVSVQPNREDATRIQKALAHLPLPHLKALNWCYTKPVNPGRACRELGATMAGLAQLLHDGRQMLINRGV